MPLQCFPHQSSQSTGIRVEMTASGKASLQRHTFPPSDDGSPPRIIVDVTSAAGNTGTKSHLEIDPWTGRIIGNTAWRPISTRMLIEIYQGAVNFKMGLDPAGIRYLDVSTLQYKRRMEGPRRCLQWSGECTWDKMRRYYD